MGDCRAHKERAQFVEVVAFLYCCGFRLLSMSLGVATAKDWTFGLVESKGDVTTNIATGCASWGMLLKIAEAIGRVAGKRMQKLFCARHNTRPHD